jgi:hypothetical protein
MFGSPLNFYVVIKRDDIAGLFEIKTCIYPTPCPTKPQSSAISKAINNFIGKARLNKTERLVSYRAVISIRLRVNAKVSCSLNRNRCIIITFADWMGKFLQPPLFANLPSPQYCCSGVKAHNHFPVLICRLSSKSFIRKCHSSPCRFSFQLDAIVERC